MEKVMNFYTLEKKALNLLKRKKLKCTQKNELCLLLVIKLFFFYVKFWLPESSQNTAKVATYVLDPFWIIIICDIRRLSETCWKNHGVNP